MPTRLTSWFLPIGWQILRTFRGKTVSKVWDNRPQTEFAGSDLCAEIRKFQEQRSPRVRRASSLSCSRSPDSPEFAAVQSLTIAGVSILATFTRSKYSSHYGPLPRAAWAVADLDPLHDQSATAGTLHVAPIFPCAIELRTHPSCHLLNPLCERVSRPALYLAVTR